MNTQLTPRISMSLKDEWPGQNLEVIFMVCQEQKSFPFEVICNTFEKIPARIILSILHSFARDGYLQRFIKVKVHEKEYEYSSIVDIPDKLEGQDITFDHAKLYFRTV